MEVKLDSDNPTNIKYSIEYLQTNTFTVLNYGRCVFYTNQIEIPNFIELVEQSFTNC